MLPLTAYNTVLLEKLNGSQLVKKVEPATFPATGRQLRRYIIPQAVTHSLVLLKIGKIFSRNMLS